MLHPTALFVIFIAETHKYHVCETASKNRGNTYFSVDSLDANFSPNITDIKEKGGESYKTYDTPPLYIIMYKN